MAGYAPLGQKSGDEYAKNSISGSLPCSARCWKNVLQCFPKFCDKGFGTIAPEDPKYRWLLPDGRTLHHVSQLPMVPVKNPSGTHDFKQVAASSAAGPHKPARKILSGSRKCGSAMNHIPGAMYHIPPQTPLFWQQLNQPKGAMTYRKSSPL